MRALLLAVAMSFAPVHVAHAWEPPDVIVAVDGGLDGAALERGLLVAAVVLATLDDHSVGIAFPSTEIRTLAPGDAHEDVLVELRRALENYRHPYAHALPTHIVKQMGLGSTLPPALLGSYGAPSQTTLLLVVGEASRRARWERWAPIFRSVRTIDPTVGAPEDVAATTPSDVVLATCRALGPIDAHECRAMESTFTLPVSQRAVVVRGAPLDHGGPWQVSMVEGTGETIAAREVVAAVAILRPYVYGVSLEHAPVVELEAAVSDVWPLFDRGLYALHVEVDGQSLELEQATGNRGRIPDGAWRAGWRTISARLSGGHLLERDVWSERRVLVPGYYDVGEVTAGGEPRCVTAEVGDDPLPAPGQLGTRVARDDGALCVRAPFFSVLSREGLDVRWIGADEAPRAVVAQLRPSPLVPWALGALVALALAAIVVGARTRRRPTHVAWASIGATYRESAARYGSLDVASAVRGVSVAELDPMELGVTDTPAGVLVEAKGDEPLLARVGEARFVRAWRLVVHAGTVVSLRNRQLIFVNERQHRELREGRLTPHTVTEAERRLAASLPIRDVESDRRWLRAITALLWAVAVTAAGVGLAIAAARLTPLASAAAPSFVLAASTVLGLALLVRRSR
jgi:hypothetical protein